MYNMDSQTPEEGALMDKDMDMDMDMDSSGHMIMEWMDRVGVRRYDPQAQAYCHFVTHF